MSRSTSLEETGVLLHALGRLIVAQASVPGLNEKCGDRSGGDVNEDGQVNVLDLIFTRNRLGGMRE